MKILILSVADKRHMTMVSQYEEYFKNNNILYDIIRLNRYIKTNKIIHYKEGVAEVYEFPFVKTTNSSKLSKIIPFLKFRRFARKLILQKKYDFLVIWNENTALLFADILLKYNDNYCFNIRDIPEIPFTKRIYDILIDKSYFSTLPTPAKIFKNDEKIITLYNRDMKIYNSVDKKTRIKEKGEILNIVFMGLYGSAPKTFKQIVKVFANDNRFRLFFYGDGFDIYLKDYITKESIRNVEVGGAFPYEMTYEYLKKTDIINSCYNCFDSKRSLKYACGVKQSYTPMLYIPAINDDNTTWASICKLYGFSYIVKNVTHSLPDELYAWYHSINFERFKNGCDRFNKEIDISIKKVFDLLDRKVLMN